MARARFSAVPFDETTKAVFSRRSSGHRRKLWLTHFPPGISLSRGKTGGGTYAKWRRVGSDGKPLPPEYIGIEGGEAHLAALDRLSDLQALASTAQTLRKLGYAGEDNHSATVLAALSNAGFFAGGGVLVGTRAFRCLTNHLGFKVVPSLATQDAMLRGRRRSAWQLLFLPEGWLSSSELQGCASPRCLAWGARSRQRLGQRAERT